MTAIDEIHTEATGPCDPFDGLPLLITVPKAAALLGLSRASAYRYATAGELPVRRLGGRVYVITEGIRNLVRQRPHHGELA
jgi:predicted DNA-binding transcriptional regulator AlpA